MILLLLQLATGAGQPPPCTPKDFSSAPSSDTIPREWLRVFLGGRCEGLHSIAMHKRIRQDTIAIALAIRLLSREQSDTIIVREPFGAFPFVAIAKAEQPQVITFFLHTTDSTPHFGATADEIAAFSFSLKGLTRAARASPLIRQRIVDATRADVREVREAAIASLLRLNDDSARAFLQTVPKRDMSFDNRRLLARLLARSPCGTDTYWSQRTGIEGQDFSGCYSWSESE